jgi:hypothetical protein
VTQYPASNLNAKLLVTKANTAGQTNLGTNAYDSVAITTSSIGATFTPWVQYVASMASEKVITGITVKLTSIGVVDWPIVIQIGVGGAGSETALCDIPVHETGSAVVPVVLPTPLRITAGSRVAARAWVSNTTGGGVSCALYGVPYVNLEGN